MNSKTRLVSAIDIGSSKIATLVAQVPDDPSSDEPINIVGVASTPSTGVRKSQIVDIEEAVESTIASVEASERMAGYNLSSAFVNVGGSHISSENSKGVVAVSNPEGEIGPDDIDRVIEAARAISIPSSREIVHVLPRDYVVDGEDGVKDPIGMSGVRLEVETHLVTASATALKNLSKTLNEVGVDVADFVFSGLASAEATLTQTERELGAVCIDIGGGTTSIAAFVDGALGYSGVIPIGAKNVTNDLAIGLRVTLDSAEKIKIALSNMENKKEKSDDADQINLEALGVEDGKKVSRRTVVEGIIRPRLNEIFSIIKIELDKSGLASRVPSGVIITGGGSLTVGAIESAKRTLSLPVRLGEPQNITGLIDDITNPSFATTIGLLRYGSRLAIPKGSFGGKMKLSKNGIIGKITDTIRGLLP